MDVPVDGDDGGRQKNGACLLSGADHAVGSGPFTDVRAGRASDGRQPTGGPASSVAVDHAQAFGGSSGAATSATGSALL